VDIGAADASSVLILAGMPTGFSVFRLSAETGECEKFLSASYLHRLLGVSARAQNWRLHYDPESHLLVLLPRKKGSPVLLDTSDAPRLKRYRIGLSSQFETGGVSFMPGGGIVFYSRPFTDAGGGSQLIVFHPDETSLRALRIERPLGVILELCPLSEERLAALGYFAAEGPNAFPMLATIELEDGRVELWEGSGNTLLAAGAGSAVAAICRRTPEVGPADEAGAPRELVVLDEHGNPLQHTQVTPIYGEPSALSASSNGFYVLMLVNRDRDFGDLWLVSTHSRAKRLVAKQVMLFGMMPDSTGFYLQPANENAVYFYRLGAVEDLEP